MGRKYNPDAKSHQKPTPVRMDAELTRRLHDYCTRGKIRLARTLVVELAIRQFLDAEDAETKSA